MNSVTRIPCAWHLAASPTFSSFNSRLPVLSRTLSNPLQVREAEKGVTPFPTAIPPISFRSDDCSGVGEGEGPQDRRADVYVTPRC